MREIITRREERIRKIWRRGERKAKEIKRTDKIRGKKVEKKEGKKERKKEGKKE